ncbi:MAG: putative quinol monooxygenase [bacterium]
MIIASVRIVLLSEKRDEILEVLSHVQGLMRSLSGCLSCAIYEEYGEPPAILYLEQWRSKEDLYRHIRSPWYLQVLAAMDLASEQPEISFHEVANSHGMELIEALRGCG